MPADAKINRKSNKNPFRTVTQIFGLIEAAITFQDFLLKSWHLLIFRHVIHAGILEISLLTELITQISDQVHWNFKMCKNCKSETVTPDIWSDWSRHYVPGLPVEILTPSNLSTCDLWRKFSWNSFWLIESEFSWNSFLIFFSWNSFRNGFCDIFVVIFAFVLAFSKSAHDAI